MEKVLLALEEKDLEMVSGGAGGFWKDFRDLHGAIIFGDKDVDGGFIEKRKVGTKKVWNDMTTGHKVGCVATDASLGVLLAGTVGTAVAGGVYAVKRKFFSK